MNHGNSLLTVKVKVAQSSPALCNPMDYAGYGILQARILEWIVYPFSRDLPNPGIEPGSPALQADFLPAELSQKLIYLSIKYTLIYQCNI